MLSYNIKLNDGAVELIEINYDAFGLGDTLYLSPDCSFMSGYTDTKSQLVNGQDILIAVNGNDDVTAKCTIQNVVRQGFGMLVGDEDESSKVFIEDGQIIINNISYQVDFLDFDTNNEFVLTLNDEVTQYKLTLFTETYPSVKFVIHKSADYVLKIEDCTCCHNFPYIIMESDFDLVTTHEGTIISPFANKWEIAKSVDGEYFLINYDLLGGNNIINEGVSYDPSVSVDFLTLRGKRYQVFEEWRNTLKGRYGHFYLDSDDYSFGSGEIILARPIRPQMVYLPLLTEEDGSSYIVYHGEKYYTTEETKDYVVIGDGETRKEYLLHYWQEDKSKAYFIINDTTQVVEINGDKAVKDANIQYNIVRYKYVEINNILHLVTIHPDGYHCVSFEDTEPLYLIVDDVKGSNQVRCHVDCKDVDGGWMGYLVRNHLSYSFELFNPLFDASQVRKVGEGGISEEEWEYSKLEYALFNPQRALNIPITLSSSVGMNLHKDFLIEHDFYEKTTKGMINRVIDMEKDVYYPAYKYVDDENITHFKMLNSLVFDLHFRTRDMDTWKINDDVYEDVSGTSYSSWNLLDHYNWDNTEDDELRPIVLDRDEISGYEPVNGVYPPADLLYFLNFTDDDVYYQKKKIEKSFLRLSFYNSKNPANQSLLAMSTIFMNEDKLFKIFMNNSVDNGFYHSVDRIEQPIERVLSATNISVKYDTMVVGHNEDGSEFYRTNMDESKRLAARFEVSNKYMTRDSAEGFYLYLFREYATDLAPQSIYMKVEFNHAGVGRTLTFMQPYRKDADGNKVMYDINDDEQRRLLKEGVRLQEIYDHIYIELEVKYDDEHGCYVYYLPEWLCQNDDKEDVMKLSLYELKIKDESSYENNTQANITE